MKRFMTWTNAFRLFALLLVAMGVCAAWTKDTSHVDDIALILTCMTLCILANGFQNTKTNGWSFAQIVFVVLLGVPSRYGVSSSAAYCFGLCTVGEYLHSRREREVELIAQRLLETP